jgi:hypothetical protein
MKNMSVSKRSKESLIIHRTLANKDALNFATKRLLHDYEEIRDSRIKSVRVTAHPLENSLFEWGCNI